MSKGASQKKSNKIYNSFPSEQQQEILKHFHKFFPSHERPEAPNKIDTKEFNQFLKKYIPYYKPNLNFSDKNVLRNLRRQVEGWLKKEIKEDLRGDPVIPPSQESEFERHVREILPELPNRNFKDFRTRILPFIKNLRSTCKKSSKKEIFSIRCWNDYLKDNPDIKKVWDSVPRKSPQKKNEKKIEESNLMPGTPSTDCPTPNTLYPSDDVVTEKNQDQNQMEIETFNSSNKKEEDAEFIEELIYFPNWELFRDMDHYFSSGEMEKSILSSDIINDDVSFSNLLSGDYYKI